MSPTTVTPVATGNTLAAPSKTDELIASGQARLVLSKPKQPVTADKFGMVVEDSKPVITADMVIDTHGRLVITLPPLGYSESRDTTSASRRSFYATCPDRVDGFITHPETGEPIPVTFALTGLNLSASARRVSADV